MSAVFLVWNCWRVLPNPSLWLRPIPSKKPIQSVLGKSDLDPVLISAYVPDTHLAQSFTARSTPNQDPVAQNYRTVVTHPNNKIVEYRRMRYLWAVVLSCPDAPFFSLCYTASSRLRHCECQAVLPTYQWASSDKFGHRWVAFLQFTL